MCVQPVLLALTDSHSLFYSAGNLCLSQGVVAHNHARMQLQCPKVIFTFLLRVASVWISQLNIGSQNWHFFKPRWFCTRVHYCTERLVWTDCLWEWTSSFLCWQLISFLLLWLQNVYICHSISTQLTLKFPFVGLYWDQWPCGSLFYTSCFTLNS